jgi:hypothetical protein
MNPGRYLMNGKMVEFGGQAQVLDDIYPIDFMPASFLKLSSFLSNLNVPSVAGLQSDRLC